MTELPLAICRFQNKLHILKGFVFPVQARGGVAVARRGKAKPGRARGLFAPPAKQVLDRSDSKLGKRRRTADYDFGDVIMPPLPGAKAVAQLPVSSLLNAVMITILILSLTVAIVVMIMSTTIQRGEVFSFNSMSQQSAFVITTVSLNQHFGDDVACSDKILSCEQPCSMVTFILFAVCCRDCNINKIIININNTYNNNVSQKNNKKPSRPEVYSLLLNSACTLELCCPVRHMSLRPLSTCVNLLNKAMTQNMVDKGTCECSQTNLFLECSCACVHACVINEECMVVLRPCFLYNHTQLSFITHACTQVHENSRNRFV